MEPDQGHATPPDFADQGNEGQEGNRDAWLGPGRAKCFMASLVHPGLGPVRATEKFLRGN